MNDLSPRQVDVLCFIWGQMRTGKICPTYREIGDALGIRSTNGVSDHIQALIRKGFLSRPEGKGSARGLTLTAKGIDMADPNPTHGLIAWAEERRREGDTEVTEILDHLFDLRAKETALPDIA